ncbi:MAG: aspartate carbamoyltransferase [Chloroflexi bacterium]|nr:aspartate carbamoyltransferase [Chloroflexota bacterium]MCL5275287.1 aspartate carbamoyltransferase [Chloroflexota bacterium]
MNSLYNRDIISIGDLSKDEIQAVLSQAAEYEQRLARGERHALGQVLQNRLLATVFYEPSTRTRLSFESAMNRLGGRVLSVAEAKTSSSAAKGETIYDSGRMLEGYADVIVQRHPAIGSARALADAAGVPVINAGDGAGEHPTQALLDLYTIQREGAGGMQGAQLRALDGLHVAMIGDLKNGRTVHSLSKALSHWKVDLTYVAPPELAMPRDVVSFVTGRGATVHESDKLSDALQSADIVYVTRIQQERFNTVEEYMKYKGVYVVNAAVVAQAKPGVAIMHPLPRVDEIATDVDQLPNAAYFRQARNGVFVRMALLSMVLGAV